MLHDQWDLTVMKSFVLLLFIFLIQLHWSRAASKYDFDEHEGRAVVLLLVIAALVFLVALMLFTYIIYKIWNGRFKHRYEHSFDYVRKDMTELKDVPDGKSYSVTTTEPLYSTVNKGLTENIVERENGSAVVETLVREDELKTEEVIVSHAPYTDQAEMETQELVIVFDHDDEVVEVFTHVDT